jgi:hypothetical protein
MVGHEATPVWVMAGRGIKIALDDPGASNAGWPYRGSYGNLQVRRPELNPTHSAACGSPAIPEPQSMGKLTALALICTMVAAVFCQPLLMGLPRQRT